MATLGVDLQHARELAGLSLDDLSARTKIRPHMLAAIERDDFAAIPGGLLARGYLRAYAGEVGLRPDTIVSRYRTEFGADPPPLTEVFKHRSHAWSLSRSEYPNGALAVVVLIAVAGVWLYVGRRHESAEGQRPVGTIGRITPAESSTDAPAEPLRDAPRSGADQQAVLLKVEINPTRVVWVEATADGKRILYALISPDQRRVIEAHQEFLLRVGDAGAFRYMVNGVQGREVGRPGEVREVRITRQNYLTFQQAAAASGSIAR